MTKDEEIDAQLLELAQAVEGQKLAALSEKVDLTLKVDKLLKKRLQLVYGRRLSRMFEEAMLSRLMKDGHLKGANASVSSSGGGAESYFNPTAHELVGSAIELKRQDLGLIFDNKKKMWRKRREDDDE